MLRPDSNSELHGWWGARLHDWSRWIQLHLFSNKSSLGPSARATSTRTPGVHLSPHFMNSAMNSYFFVLAASAAAKIKSIKRKLRVLPVRNLLECTRQRVPS